MNRQAVNQSVRLLALICAFCSISTLWGDEILLKNGSVIEGRIVAETSKRVVVEVPYGRMTLEVENIEKIIRESEAEYLKGASERVFQAGDFEHALELLRRRCALEPDNRELEPELATQLLRAVDEWTRVRRLDKAEAGLAEVARRGGDPALVAEANARVAAILKKRAERENRARRAWEEGEIETAYRFWSELREEFPHRAERWRKPLGAAALRLGHDALLGRRLDTARAYYLECLELDPDRLPDVREPFALCEIERIRPDMQAGKYQDADRELTAALEVLPEEPALLFHRALIVEAIGDYREAAKIYAKLAGEKNRTIQGQKYLEELRSRAANQVQQGVALAFQEEHQPQIPSPEHAELRKTKKRGAFIVHHASGFDPEPVLAALTRHLARFEKNWFGNQRALPKDLEVSVYLHPGRTALLSGDGPKLTGCDGYVRTTRRYGVLLGQEIHLNAESPQLITGVIPHELAHLLLPHRVGRGIDFPAWLDEGIACNEEPELLRRHRRRTIIDARAAGTDFPLAELLAAGEVPGERTGIFYAQSTSVVEFLHERLGLIDLLAFAKKCALEGAEPALSELAGYATVADLQLAWSRWVSE